jgi:hypothetical protein
MKFCFLVNYYFNITPTDRKFRKYFVTVSVIKIKQQQKRKKMNPVLGSTSDFNQYIKEKLDRASSNENGGKTTERSKEVRVAKFSSQIQYQNKDKYLREQTLNTKVSADNESPAVSYQFNHSWKAYVKKDPVSVPIVTIIKNEKSHQSSRLTSNRPIHKSKVEIDDDMSGEFDRKVSIRQSIEDNYNRRIRVFRLGKLFRAWRSNFRQHNHLCERAFCFTSSSHMKYMICTYYQEWYNLWKATTFFQVRFCRLLTFFSVKHLIYSFDIIGILSIRCIIEISITKMAISKCNFLFSSTAILYLLLL